MNYISKPKQNLKGVFNVAPDKSISHRAVMFSSICEGISEIENFLCGDDCIATIDCFRKLGIKIEINGTNVNVFGKGMHGLTKPTEILDVKNSGTTIRLMSGLLSGQNFETVMTGDSSIKKRPMDRVIIPLKEMNANIHGENNTGFAPLYISKSFLKGINYTQKVSSAQVKSAIILASLYASGTTYIYEPISSRNHTELMLNYLGANITTENNTIISSPVNQLKSNKIIVPNDISSAAFFIVAALISKNSNIKITNVGINPTRTGIVDALIEMGGDIEILNERVICGELVGDIQVKSSKLKGITIGGSIIPRMIDEIPIFALASVYADGVTVVKNAEELKVKESNRVKTISEQLNNLGANITETEDGLIIQGNMILKGGEGQSYNDHRISMTLAIAGLVSKEEVIIKDSECASVSFPNFFSLLESL